jgi:hypothetical protein
MEFRLRNPHQRAILTLAGLAGFSLLATLASLALSSVGIVNSALTWISFVFFVFLGLIWIIILLLGLREVRRAKTFLESDRPLVRWTYSLIEWQQLKEAVWKEESGDWKVQFGCLTLLLALAGLLTGVMLGLEGDFFDVIVNGVIGLVLGGLAGATIGALVAGGNFLGSRQAYGRSEPGQVALGPNEIYASDDYFKGDGVNGFIRMVAIHHGSPTTLEFQLVVPPRPRMPREEQWIIPVPSQWVERVEEILLDLAPDREESATE